MTTRRSLIIAALASASIATAACGTTSTTTTQHQATVPAWVATAQPLKPYPAFATVLGLDRTFGQINQTLKHLSQVQK